MDAFQIRTMDRYSFKYIAIIIIIIIIVVVVVIHYYYYYNENNSINADMYNNV